MDITFICQANFKQDAELGDAKAQAALAALYILGLDRKDVKGGAMFTVTFENLRVAKNIRMSNNGYEQAYYWAEKSAQQNDEKGQFILAYLCFNGFGTEKNIPQAMQWLTKSAEQGYIASQKTLAAICLEGDGVEKNPHEAFKWIKRAAMRGDKEAAFEVAIYYLGEPPMSPQVKNYQEGFEWLSVVAEGKFGPAIQAQSILGQMYLYGSYGISKDEQRGLYWLHRATQNDPDMKFPTAHIKLATFYLENDNISENDKEKNLNLLKSFAEKDNAEAIYELGICYYQGKGVSLDYQKTLEYLLKAAQSGDMRAPFSLASFYEDDLGDKHQARRWYKEAADNGDHQAIEALAKLDEEEKEIPHQTTEKHRRSKSAKPHSSTDASSDKPIWGGDWGKKVEKPRGRGGKEH